MFEMEKKNLHLVIGREYMSTIVNYIHSSHVRSCSCFVLGILYFNYCTF